jgi:hypothetical protein
MVIAIFSGCILSIVCAASQGEAKTSNPDLGLSQEVRIFFLGNSYTAAGGGQQRLVPKLLEAGQGVVVRVGHSGHAGETLQGYLERNRGEWPRWRKDRAVEKHLPKYKKRGKGDQEIEAIFEKERAAYRQEKGSLDKAIADGGPWDYVILQVSNNRLDDSEEQELALASAVNELVTKFRKANPESIILLYSTWVDQESPELQFRTDMLCKQLAGKYGLRMAPAGTAMHKAHAERPKLNLFRTNTDSHPGIHGAYLAACTLYATITGHSPIDLPNSFIITTSNDFGNPNEEKTKLFKIKEDDARYLQKTAWQTCIVNQFSCSPKDANERKNTLCQSSSDFSSSAAEPHHPFPDHCWGVYGRGQQWNPKKVNRQTTPLIKGVTMSVHWRDIEPKPGRFEFNTILGNRLKAAIDNDYYVYLSIYFAPDFPGWLEQKGVRLFHTEPGIGGNGTLQPTVWAYYLDDRYKKYYYRVLQKTGDYLRSLPQKLSQRILYVECNEGSTGDPGPYKHKTLNSKYTISPEQWLEFRIAAWDIYRQAFQKNGLNIPLLFKTNRRTMNKELDYLFDHFDIFGLKQGQASHGYNMNNTQPDLLLWRNVNARAQRQGKMVFSRGEMDTVWQKCGWAAKYPQQFLYWAAIFASHYGIDMWDMRYDACLSGKSEAGVRFFNKYANERHDPEIARHAFCAFRRGLDASDANTFSQDIYGKAESGNVQRYLAIAKAFRDYGAVQGDPNQGASGSRMVSRRRKVFNDVGWKTERGNYCRYLTQISPEKTSIAYWHKGPSGSIQGRFARGFDIAAGKSQMFFRLDDKFLPSGYPVRLLLRVIYLDEGKGTWNLSYASAGDMKEAIHVINSDSGQWKEKTVIIYNAAIDNSGPHDSDLVLTGKGSDSVFHMIEVEKLSISASASSKN